MPWRETNPVKERQTLIARWERGGVSVAQLAVEAGVSRKTAHKWIARYQIWQGPGLEARSRAPRTHPTRTPDAVRTFLVQTKLAHLTWGPKKLLGVMAERAPDLRRPAISTAAAILHQAGLVRPSKRRRRTPPWTASLVAGPMANDTWSIDFKGWFRTGDGSRCEPLTVCDVATRYCLLCQSLPHPRAAEVRRVLTRVFRRYGLPRVIRTDNGPPFASAGLGGLSALALWWIKLGILPERITPAHPQENGRHERLHRTLTAEALQPVAPTLRAQQRAFDRFVQTYNHERPHEALGQCPPARRYHRSPRPYPATLPELTYPATMTVRRVRSNGEIKWHGRKIFLSTILHGEPVGLAPLGNGRWTIQFGPLRIGMLDTRSSQVFKIPVEVSPMSLE